MCSSDLRINMKMHDLCLDCAYVFTVYRPRVLLLLYVSPVEGEVMCDRIRRWSYGDGVFGLGHMETSVAPLGGVTGWGWWWVRWGGEVFVRG